MRITSDFIRNEIENKRMKYHSTQKMNESLMA